MLCNNTLILHHMVDWIWELNTGSRLALASTNQLALDIQNLSLKCAVETVQYISQCCMWSFPVLVSCHCHDAKSGNDQIPLMRR
jgi:hypothetical protein